MDPKIKLAEHKLSDGCRFYEGMLPEQLTWDDSTFEQAWSLHPPERHKVFIIRETETPRWQQSYGANYSYSGSQNNALPIPPLVQRLLKFVQAEIDSRENGVLFNWYEGSPDYIGPHRDSRKGLIVGTPIVTISFGEERTFRLTRGKGSDKESLNFQAPHGTLFVMPWPTNLAWKHGVPKSTRYCGRRISITFRAFATGVLPPEEYFVTD